MAPQQNFLVYLQKENGYVPTWCSLENIKLHNHSPTRTSQYVYYPNGYLEMPLSLYKEQAKEENRMAYERKKECSCTWEEALGLPTLETIDEIVFRQERLSQLQEFVKSLPPPMHSIYILYYGHGFSERRTGLCLGLPSYKVHYLLRKLRSEAKDYLKNTERKLCRKS